MEPAADMYNTPAFNKLSIFRSLFPDESAMQALTNVAPAVDAVPREALTEPLANISRRFARFPLKNRTLDLYTAGTIILLANKRITVTRVLPAWRVRVGGAVKAYVNLTPYAPAGNAANIDIRKLYGLMQYGAALVDGMNNFDRLSMSSVLLTDGAKVYARMMSRVADRICGFGVDRGRELQVRYLFAKYFMRRLMGRSLNATTEGAALAAANGISEAAADSIQNAMAAAAKAEDQDSLFGQDLTAFISVMPEAAPWLRRMTARGFVQTFTATFGDGAFFAMEELTYFLAAMASHEAETDIVNSYALESSFEREGENVVAEMARLFRR